MTNSTPSLTDKDIIADDDDDIILLTDEISLTEKPELFIETNDDKKPQIRQDFIKQKTFDDEIDFFDLSEVLEEKDPKKEAKDQTEVDELQRLINEVVHESHPQLLNFSTDSQSVDGKDYKAAEILKGDLTSLSRTEIDAAVDRVIRNILAEKIEPLIDDFIKTMANQEIENLKKVVFDYIKSSQFLGKN